MRFCGGTPTRLREANVANAPGTPKYAQPENERRALVDPARCPSLARTPFDLIEDVYIANTRMRLRGVTEADSGQRVFKLCKKYPSSDPLSAPIVNVYLTRAEHAVFARLPGWSIRKRRYRLTLSGATYAVDVFQGDLDGLILCEIEGSTRDVVREAAFPDWAPVDVTVDIAFTGGRLCRTKADEIATRVAVALTSATAGIDPKGRGAV